jgi:hypothetical protein
LLVSLCLGSRALPAAAQTQTSAATPTPELTLVAGASCLERDRLIARIVHWREGAATDPSLRVHVRGDTRDATKVFFSVVRAGMEPAERLLDNAPLDCDQLHSAVALSIALAIDASMAVAQRPPLTAAIPEQPARREPPREFGKHLEAALLAGASIGLVPSTTMVATPRIQYAPLPWLAFAVEGLGTYAHRLNVGSAPGQFDATLFALGVDVCLGGETAERMSFFTCAGARGGTFLTNAYGFTTRNYRASRNWWALTGSGQARAWLLPMFGIGIAVEAVFAVAARDLVVTVEGGTQTSQRLSVPRVGLSISAGPVFRFF